MVALPRLRLLSSFVALAFALSACPAKEEPKKDDKKEDKSEKDDKKKKKGDDEEDEDSPKKKKKKGDDDALEADAVCEHVHKLVKEEPDHKWAARFEGDKCQKGLSKFEQKLEAEAYQACLKCVNDAEDLDALGKDCEKPCDKGKKKAKDEEDE